MRVRVATGAPWASHASKPSDNFSRDLLLAAALRLRDGAMPALASPMQNKFVPLHLIP